MDCAFMSMYDLCNAVVQRLGGGHGSPERGGSWSDVRAAGDRWLSDKMPELV